MSLDIYIMTDQPETCRRCGTRTNYEDINKSRQLHQCGNCHYTYWLEDGTVPCLKCGSSDVLEDIFDDLPAVICKFCRTIFHRDEGEILNQIDPVAYFGK